MALASVQIENKKAQYQIVLFQLSDLSAFICFPHSFSVLRLYRSKWLGQPISNLMCCCSTNSISLSMCCCFFECSMCLLL